MSEGSKYHFVQAKKRALCLGEKTFSYTIDGTLTQTRLLVSFSYAYLYIQTDYRLDGWLWEGSFPRSLDAPFRMRLFLSVSGWKLVQMRKSCFE